MKICTECNKDKNLDDYHSCKKGKHGRKSKCKACRVSIRKLRYAETKEHTKIQNKKWLEANPDSQHNNYLKNKEKIIIKATKWNKENRDSRREICRKYSRNNKGIVNAATAKRRAARIQRTPKWVETQEIKLFYKNCEEGYEVDHIYPLQGKKCSGLHVLANLQYLSKEENRKKGTKMPEEWENEKK